LSDILTTAEAQRPLREVQVKWLLCQRRKSPQPEEHLMVKRKQYDERFKATVALEAAKEQKTIAQIASEYSVHPNQVGKWKKQLLSDLPQLFADGRKKENENNEQLTAELYQQIGQLKVELDWLKKKAGLLG
jgi:putative transposase